MLLNRNLFKLLSDTAGRVTVDQVILTPAYTAVTTLNGGMGIAATGIPLDNRHSGSLDITAYKGRPAMDLLEGILAPDLTLRTIALALINALIRPYALKLPEDYKNISIFEHLNIHAGSRVAMVGHIRPLARALEKTGAILTVIDKGKGIGEKKSFYHHLQARAEILILTATSIINNTIEEVLSHANPELQTVILGPSTPMLADAFKHPSIRILAGTVITDRQGALNVMRHAKGPGAFGPFSRKVYGLVNQSGAEITKNDGERPVLTPSGAEPDTPCSSFC